MFGHQDEDQKTDDSQISIPQDAVDGAAANPPVTVPPNQSADNGPGADTSLSPDSPSTITSDTISPAGGFPKMPTFPSNGDHSLPSEDAATHDLVEIKQQALTELSPLIDKLDQTPEERFRTLMMMIQASDNQQLVKSAFDAAHSINDEKTRAQALLDVINEVNYFTTPHEQ